MRILIVSDIHGNWPALLAVRDGHEPLSAVAAACGFYDQAVLTRQFRELTGVPPGEYRRAFRNVGG